MFFLFCIRTTVVTIVNNTKFSTAPTQTKCLINKVTHLVTFYILKDVSNVRITYFGGTK